MSSTARTASSTAVAACVTATSSQEGRWADARRAEIEDRILASSEMRRGSTTARTAGSMDTRTHAMNAPMAATPAAATAAPGSAPDMMLCGE